MSLPAELSCLQVGGGAEGEAALPTLEKQLICPICLELFNKPVVILPCQHNLCRKCANELYQPSLFQARTTMQVNSGRFRCPSCRQEVVLDRHGVYGLPRNLLVENIIDVYKQEVINNSKAASPVPPPSLFPAQMTCSDHEGERVNIYCLTCQVPTCSLCKVFGAHQSCQVAPLTDIYQQKKDELIEGVSSLVSVNDKVQALINELEETCKNIEENCKTQKQSVCEKFDRVFLILEERRKVMTQRISSEQEEKTSHAQSLVRCYGDSVEANSKLVERAVSSMEEPDMAAFVQNSRELITKVITATGSCPAETLKPGCESLSHYIFNFNRQERALRSIDFITVLQNVPEEPVLQNVPEEPVVQNVPEEPMVQNVPEEPVVQNVPEEPVVKNVPEEPVVQHVPEEPVVQNVLEEPVLQNVPEEPVVQHVPEEPEVQNVPEEPMVQNVPEEPVVLNVPEEPVLQNVLEEPVVQNILEEPVLQNVPEEPVVQHVPEEPVLQNVPEEPVVQHVPEEPVVQHVPEEPVVQHVPEEPVVLNVPEEPVLQNVPEEPVVEKKPEEPRTPSVQIVEPKHHQETSPPNPESVVEPMKELIPTPISPPVRTAAPTPASVPPAPGLVKDSVEHAWAVLQLETNDPDLNDGESGLMKNRTEDQKEQAEGCAAAHKEGAVCEEQEGMSTQQAVILLFYLLVFLVLLQKVWAYIGCFIYT